LQRHLVAQGHPEGQPVKPSQIQAVAGAPTVTAPPRADLPNTSEEHFYRAFAREKGYKDFESMPTKLQTEARAQWTTAGRSDQVSLDAAIMAAYHRGDQVELQRLLRLKGQVSDAGRAPEKDHEPSKREESRLDEKVAYLLRHPKEATSVGWRELARAYQALGVDYVARRDAVARQVARGGAGDPLAPTADDLVAEFEKAIAGQGSAPPSGGPGGGRTQRTATAAEVKRAAKIAGMSEAEYRKQLASRGVVIKD
jgi:hypothetical protein